MMKILYIASDNYRGSGAFLSMVNLAKLMEKNYNVDVLAILPEKGNGEELLKDYSIPFKYIRSLSWCIRIDRRKLPITKLKILLGKVFNIIPIIRLVFTILINKIDIIHINTSYSYVGAVAGKLCKKPIIWHIREMLEEGQGCEIWNKKKGYRLINKSTEIITISKAIFEKYQKILDQRKMKVILNGIDESDYYIANHKILNIDFLQLSIIGTISERKGQFFLVEAIDKLIIRGYKNFSVWIIGKGNTADEERLLNLIKQKKLEKYILLCGYQKDIPKWLEKTDIVLSCCNAEGFGRTTVEAMLAGCLVIGVKAAGTKELIVENQTGLLYQEGNVENLTDQIERVINDKNAMVKIAQKGQQYMLRNMTASINAEKIYKEYCRILKSDEK